MGCHTWFRNEWKHIPKKGIKILIVTRLKEQANQVNKLDTFAKYREFMISYYNECVKSGDTEMANYLFPKINSKTAWKKDCRDDYRYKRLKRRKISRHELIRNLKRLDWCYYPDKYYNVPRTYGDNFRIYDYDTEPWHSVEEFDEYIKNNPDKKIACNSDNPYEYARNILKQFFEEYPHGIVELG